MHHVASKCQSLKDSVGEVLWHEQGHGPYLICPRFFCAATPKAARTPPGRTSPRPHATQEPRKGWTLSATQGSESCKLSWKKHGHTNTLSSSSQSPTKNDQTRSNTTYKWVLHILPSKKKETSIPEVTPVTSTCISSPPVGGPLGNRSCQAGRLDSSESGNQSPRKCGSPSDSPRVRTEEPTHPTQPNQPLYLSTSSSLYLPSSCFGK